MGGPAIIAELCKESKGFDAFETRFGVDAAIEVLERIADASWSHLKAGVGVEITDSHMINASNHVYSGTIVHAGETFAFVIESGDNNGTVVLEWGDPDDVESYTPEPPTFYTMAPNWARQGCNPSMLSVYQHWTKTDWFKAWERGYNYDRTFAPGVKTEDHYRKLPAQRGMRIVSREEAAAYLAPIDEAKMKAEWEQAQAVEKALVELFQEGTT